ncbi:MAG: hypothetical protein CMJ67_05315 [Planctomycetaceae bacterium]|nr:hypothetical protein [Planctomycetaceae bacterium]
MFLGTLAIMFGIADADVITVDDDDPSADFSSIQEAVDAAVSGDRIEVGPGVYVANWKGAQPVVSVSGKSLDIVAISNNPANTVISGENERRCVEWEFAFGGTLEGFTFDSGATNTNGGAVYLDYVGVTIEDCVFQNCSAGNSGGAIYSLSDTVFPPIARDCRFVSNDAVRNGGAIFALGGYDLYDCVFEENTAIDYGGGIYFDENPPMGAVLFSVITNCDFRDCAAMYGGGVYGVEATLWVTDSRFDDCIAGDSFAKTGWGGGIALGLGELQMSGGRFLRCEGGQSSGGLDADQSLAVCSGVSFTECTGWVTGGGVYAFGAASRLDLEDCSFDSNVAANDGGAAISCESSVASLDLLRCTFDDNLGLDDGF